MQLDVYEYTCTNMKRNSVLMEYRLWKSDRKKATEVLAQCADFKIEQCMVEAKVWHRHIFELLHKFYYELNPVELMWCMSKQYVCTHWGIQSLLCVE